MANTLLNAVKDLRNDSLREIVSASAFTGEIILGFQGSNYGYASGGGANPGLIATTKQHPIAVFRQGAYRHPQ